MSLGPTVRWHEPPEIYRETMRGMGALLLRPILAFGILWLAICGFYAYRTAARHPDRLGAAVEEAALLTIGYAALTGVLVGRFVFRLRGSTRSTTFEVNPDGLRTIDNDDSETHLWPEILSYWIEDHPTIAGVRSLIFHTEAEGWDQWVLPSDPADRETVESALRQNLGEPRDRPDDIE